jgi:uncharacterized Zn finger protein
MKKKFSLENFEELFGGQFLERGEEYYNEGLVKKVLRNKNLVTARVQGNHLYTVKVNLSNGEMTCTCPCDFNCKHMAAVLYALRANKASNMEKLFLPLLSKSKQELEEIIQKMVFENPELAIYINPDNSNLEKEIKQFWPGSDETTFQTKAERLHELITKKPNPLELELKFFKKLFQIFDHFGEDERVENIMFKVLDKINRESKKPENKAKRKKIIKEIKELVKEYDWFLDSFR